VRAADPDAEFRAVCAAKAEQSPVVRGNDGWLFLPAELRHISVGKFWGEEAARVSKASKPENADPLPAILDFKKQLDALGIELILVPVPAKAFVYSQALLDGKSPASANPATRLDTFHGGFYQELTRNGVTVVDLLPDYLAKRDSESGALYCKTDSHWSGRGIAIAADKIAALLQDKPWLKAARDAAKLKTVAKEQEVEIAGDLRGMLTADQPAAEKVKLRFISTDATGGPAPVAADKASPVVLMGDSHNLVFNAGGDMLASGAGLADQLAHLLGIPVDLVAVRGSGATPARVNLMRRAKADPQYLGGKKVVIWCFTVREFTEGSGWSKVALPTAAK
jgi:alginate O-acetyltransferase complex protein AlgJ